ncbi:hypothetical protein EW145_g1021 [Phellinidium pouzarii]|uniref:Uracil-DNA glycosylase n=1 Tax=Phellinidium pouzarii TaxID=167371 RepID=A0A4S4LG39_9AGAM|nr:hypothetical protein EW145_g1021 [Phellinidium pouzarii]
MGSVAEAEGTVYLEDLEVKRKDVATLVSVPASRTETNPAIKATGAAVTGKRQRTLMEMVVGSAKTKGPEQASKKAKLTRTCSTISAGGSPSSSSPVVTTFGLQPLNSVPFSMQAFKDSLTEEQRRLLELECETMGKSWLKILKDEIKKHYFIDLKKFLWSEGVQGPDVKTNKVFPAPRNIYAWSNTPLGRVRVVIIGQDPYHGPGQAHGLCFSVPHGVAVPPSLRNIYAEIRAEYTQFSPPKHGNLTAWANSGVLLLNTALTVRNGDAGSHSKRGWETFTDKVIEVVDKYGGANLGGTNGVGRGIVFMAWGAWAAKRVEKLDKHPSPLSASRGFFGNGHFKAANDWLEARYGKDELIDWCKLDLEEPAQSP